MITVLSFYFFLDISAEKLAELNAALNKFASETGTRGLVVTGQEGINATVSGSHESMDNLLLLLASQFSIHPDKIKKHQVESHPFRRFKVDCRPEIVTIKSGVSASQEGMLTPEQWHQTLLNEEDIVLLDVRNRYETAIGLFEDAIDPKIDKFSDFGSYLDQAGIAKNKKVLMYCTGGIRCEKAAVEMRNKGYPEVYQLEGGILKYMEQFPEGLFKGECFVFDHRVAVDKDLQPSKIYKLCPHCGNPAAEKINCTKCSKEAVVCAGCLQQPQRHSCSKNCAHHLLMAINKCAASVLQGSSANG